MEKKILICGPDNDSNSTLLLDLVRNKMKPSYIYYILKSIDDDQKESMIRDVDIVLLCRGVYVSDEDMALYIDEIREHNLNVIILDVILYRGTLPDIINDEYLYVSLLNGTGRDSLLNNIEEVVTRNNDVPLLIKISLVLLIFALLGGYIAN